MTFIVSLLTSVFFIVPSVKGESLDLTEEERAFIAEHPVVEIGIDPEFVPFEFIDEDGEYKGIVRDILSLIEEQTGLQFKVQENLTWLEAYDLAMGGKLDGLAAVGKTPEREKEFILSRPYFQFKRVIVTRSEDTNVMNVEDLDHTAIAVQKNSSHHSYLLQQKNIHLSLYDTAEAALVAVATGEEKYYVGNLATTKHILRTNGIADLRVIAYEADKRQGLYFAGYKGHPELVSIFNKAFSMIEEDDIRAISSKWINIDTDVDYGPLLRVTAAIVVVFIIILSVSSYWIFRLRKEMRVREDVETSLVKANEKADQMNIELQMINEELETMSMVDGLTGVFNRRYLDHSMQELWDTLVSEKFPIGFLMIDIDCFKTYNDTHGHLSGDQCLKEVAQAIVTILKEDNGFVARYGGEEFAVLLLNTDEETTMRCAQKIRHVIEQLEIDINGQTTSVTASIGVSSLLHPRQMSIASFIQKADGALYEAKRLGRNRVIHADDINPLEQTNIHSLR